MKRRAFTLIELLVVLAMIAILMGAVGVSTTQARKRAKITKATQEMKEITNAIIAFEQYAKNRSLDGYTTGGWKECNESSLSMILGGVTGESGEKVPVLFSASIGGGGKIIDPWGNPYEFIIEKTASLGSGDGTAGSGVSYSIGVHLPNFFRLQPEERAIPERGR
jgi:prepilin-type N-terminal cleavage/methylation domain-containing protein